MLSPTAQRAPHETHPVEPALQLVDVAELSARHPGLSVSALRALIVRSERNGLAKHIYRIGRRVLIDAPGFETWVRSNPSNV